MNRDEAKDEISLSRTSGGDPQTLFYISLYRTSFPHERG